MENEFTIYIDRKVVLWQRTTYTITPQEGQTREEALEIIKREFLENPEYLDESDMVEWCDVDNDLEGGYLLDYDDQPTAILYQEIEGDTFDIDEVEDNTPIEVRREKKLKNILN